MLGTANDVPMRLFVVVPCYNEADGLQLTLDALSEQTDRAFELVIVDNASTDLTYEVAVAFGIDRCAPVLRVISESQKGTGAAADTGFRSAIFAGATHIARTDADCLPRRDWIANIKLAFARGSEFVVGRVHFRTDDVALGWTERTLLAFLGAAMNTVAPLLSHNRGSQFRCRYVMTSGGNLALTSSLYLACGGFPRIGLEQDNEDRLLLNRARELTPNIRRHRAVVVAQSARRVREYGVRNTILWYWNRKYRPVVVDVR